jgi:hypothetical protein
LTKKKSCRRSILLAEALPVPVPSSASRRRRRGRGRTRENGEEKDRKEAKVSSQKKERNGRIATAVDAMRTLVPGITSSTNTVTATEITSKFLLFVKHKLGDRYDEEFLRNNASRRSAAS